MLLRLTDPIKGLLCGYAGLHKNALETLQRGHKPEDEANALSINLAGLDLNAPPIGDQKMRWPDREAYDGGYAEFFPSWERFWSADFLADCDVPAPAARDEFLARIGPEETNLSVRVR